MWLANKMKQEYQQMQAKDETAFEMELNQLLEVTLRLEYELEAVISKN